MTDAQIWPAPVASAQNRQAQSRQAQSRQVQGRQVQGRRAQSRQLMVIYLPALLLRQRARFPPSFPAIA